MAHDDVVAIVAFVVTVANQAAHDHPSGGRLSGDGHIAVHDVRDAVDHATDLEHHVSRTALAQGMVQRSRQHARGVGIEGRHRIDRAAPAATRNGTESFRTRESVDRQRRHRPCDQASQHHPTGTHRHGASPSKLSPNTRSATRSYAPMSTCAPWKRAWLSRSSPGATDTMPSSPASTAGDDGET